MAHPWLSILIPVYGVEQYLQDCVDSVLGQGVDGIEVLLLDDVSPDRSGAIARELQQRHPDVVRVFAHSRNRGLSAARNSLLERAAGRYVWFLDSDDLLLPGAIAGLRRVVEADAPDLVLCDFRVVRTRLGLKHRLRGELHRRTFRGRATGLSRDRAALVAGMLPCRQLHTWSKIARREVWRQVRFPEGRAFEDMAVIPALVGAVQSYRHVPAPWVGYRQRPGSILATWSDDRLGDLLQSLRDLHRGLIGMPELADQEARFALDYFCLRTFALLARRFCRSGSSGVAPADCRAAFQELFPQGAARVLARCSRHGWWLRRWRLQRSLVMLEQAA